MLKVDCFYVANRWKFCIIKLFETATSSTHFYIVPLFVHVMAASANHK